MSFIVSFLNFKIILYFKYIRIKKAKSTQKLFINYLFNYQLTIDPICLFVLI